jgi:hypothetical protein
MKFIFKILTYPKFKNLHAFHIIKQIKLPINSIKSTKKGTLKIQNSINIQKFTLCLIIKNLLLMNA